MSSQLSNDNYGHSVNMSSDGLLDSYYVGGAMTYSFPTGTPQAAAYLSFTIQINLSMFMTAIQVYIQNLFPLQTQQQFVIEYLTAQAASKVDRQAYIGQLLTWVDQIDTYAAAYVASVKAQTDPAVVATMQFDPRQIPATPNVTLVEAISIST